MNLTIVITNAGSTAGRIITTSHKGKPDINWSVPSRVWTTSSDKTEMMGNAIYEQLNQFIESLPMETQDKIYNIYEEIYRIYDSAGDGVRNHIEQIVLRTQKKLAEMYSLIDEKKFNHWVWDVLRPNIPADLKQSFEIGMPGTPERTYLVPDYRELIPLCIIMRLATPVWMQFITLANDTLPRTQKDTFAFALVGKTWMMSSSAMKRLRVFTDHTIGTDRYQDAAIHEGISSDDYTDWVLASMIVRKASVIDVTGAPGTPIIPSALWKFIDSKPHSIASSAPKINFKDLPSESGSDDANNASILEGSRTREKMSIGQRRSNPFYLERTCQLLDHGILEPLGLLKRVCPEFEVDLYKDALSTAMSLMSVEIIDEQVGMAAWIFDPYLSARSIGNIRKEETIKLLALAQTVLLLQGKPYLAAMVTARYQIPPRDRFFANTSLINPPLQRHQQFAETFPLQKEFHRASSISSNGPRANTRIFNYAQSTIFDLVAGFEQYMAFRTISEKAIDRFYPKDAEKRFIQIQYPRDLKLQVMDLCEELAHRKTIKIDPMKVYESIMENKVNF